MERERFPKRDMSLPIAVSVAGNVSVVVRSSALRRASLILSGRNIACTAETVMKTVLWVQSGNEAANEPNRKKNFLNQSIARRAAEICGCADSKCVTDITEIKASDGKLYVSAVFDCFDSSVVGLAMDTNRRAPLCVQTLENTFNAYPGIRGAIIHSDRGSQYTSQLYRDAVRQYGIQQSMNSAGGRCHDNARCESMWARMKSELLYGRYDTEKMTTEELRTIIWRYFISYWNNRRICSANGGLPPMVKRQQYYDSLKEAA